MKFVWDNPTASCNSYTVQTSLDPSFNVIFLEEGNFWKDLEILFEEVRDTTEIFWRVQSHPDEDVENKDQVFSEVYSFTLAVPNEVICYKCGTYYCTTGTEIFEQNVSDTIVPMQAFSIAVVEGEFSGYSFKISMNFNILGNNFNHIVYGTENEDVIGGPKLQYNAPNVNDILSRCRFGL